MAMKINNIMAMANYEIQLAWVPSHIGLKGNEKADSWAKNSLGYRQITRCAISPDTFKRKTDISLINYWQRKWESEEVRNRFRLTISPYETECHKVRREEIILCRLRADATMLTHMIPYIEKRYPPICEECNEQLTVPHILIDCLNYVRERRIISNFF